MKVKDRMLIVWNDELSTEIVSIDREHKTLIEKINAISMRIDQDFDFDFCRRAVDRLTDDILANFHSEERVMLNIHFPDYVVHKKQHELLIEELLIFRERLDVREGAKDFNLMFNFLHYWFLQHLSVEDVRIRRYITRETDRVGLAITRRRE